MLLADSEGAADAVQQVFARWRGDPHAIGNDAHYVRRAVRTEASSATAAIDLPPERSSAVLEGITKRFTTAVAGNRCVRRLVAGEVVNCSP